MSPSPSASSFLAIRYPSMLALLDMCDAIEAGSTLDPQKSNRKVLGLDIDIRQHNREAIEAHAMSSRIQMIQGGSFFLLKMPVKLRFQELQFCCVKHSKIEIAWRLLRENMNLDL